MVPVEKVRLLQSLLNTLPMNVVGNWRPVTSGEIDPVTIAAWKAVNHYMDAQYSDGSHGSDIESISAEGMYRDIDQEINDLKAWVQMVARQQRSGGGIARRPTPTPVPQPQAPQGHDYGHIDPSQFPEQQETLPQTLPDDYSEPSAPPVVIDEPMPMPPTKRRSYGLALAGLAAGAAIVGVGLAMKYGERNAY
jgi:hypothetical protein